MSAHYFLASVVFIVSLALAGPLAAQPMAAPASPLVQPTQWSAGYGEARAAMLGGDFGAAAAKFAALVESAPDPASRILALEMMSACRTWAGEDSYCQRHRAWR